MNEAAVTHDTCRLERTYAASPARVFAAFSDVNARLRWGPPSDEQALVYDIADFRVGGTDVSRCGPKGDLMFTVETHYHDIVADRRIVFSETVSGPDGRLSVSLLTVALDSISGATRLSLTIQVASFVGDEMVRGNRNGWTAALRNLDAEVSRAIPSA